MSTAVKMTVNGKAASGTVESRTLLVQFLRETLGMTGTHVGCDTSQCGACVVEVDGKSVKSCTMLAVQAEGAKVITIEGLANGDLHPMQAAFRENHGLQCGFCTPGMVMSAIDLVKHNKDPNETEIREWLEGNICRCTGYHNIVKSIKAGGAAVRRKEDFRFLTGHGTYTDDINRPGQLHAWMLRSPHAHARIKAIDTKA